MSDTDSWVELPERPGYRCKLIKHGNITIRVFRPILTDKERQRTADNVVGRTYIKKL